MLLKLLEPGQGLVWQRVLALELIRNICGDFNLLRFIYQTYSREDASGGIYHTLLNVLNHVAAETPQAFREMTGDNDAVILHAVGAESNDEGVTLDAQCRPKVAW
jgi:hypothetical protein